MMFSGGGTPGNLKWGAPVKDPKKNRFSYSVRKKEGKKRGHRQ